MILSETPHRKRVTKLVNWGHWFTLVNIIIAVVFASVYLVSSPLPDTLLGAAYMFANWFSHMAFLVFFVFVICILPACYLVSNVKIVKGCASAIAAIGQALLAFDALLYNRTGLHISFGSADILAYEAQATQTELGWQQWAFLLLLFLVWLSFQLIIGNALWQRIERFQRYKLATPISSFFVICFVFSHMTHVWADANLYQPIVKQDNMFPLSYPATAKTVMSRYGLLDIEDYQQRESLQFDPSLGVPNYPAAPVYCSISTSRKLVLLIQTDGASFNPAGDYDLRQLSHHFNLNEDLPTSIVSTLFGLPELYSAALQDKSPVLLDLPSALGLPVYLYAHQAISQHHIASYQVDWEAFKAAIQVDKAKLAIGFVSGQQLEQIANDSLFNQHQVIISSFNDNNSHSPQPLYSNAELQNVLSSSEDLAPTLLEMLDCHADAKHYSTGQSLLSPKREWVVSTQGEKLIVLHNGLRIEVMSNGSHEIIELENGNRSGRALNVQLLSRAINHLTHFSRKN